MASIGEWHKLTGITDDQEDDVEVATYRNNGEIWLRIKVPIFVAPETLNLEREVCDKLYDLSDRKILRIVRDALVARLRAVAHELGDWRADASNP